MGLKLFTLAALLAVAGARPHPQNDPDGIAQPWGQCGGLNWPGPRRCTEGWTCVYNNTWFSNCLQVTTTATATPAPSSTSTH